MSGTDLAHNVPGETVQLYRTCEGMPQRLNMKCSRCLPTRALCGVRYWCALCTRVCRAMCGTELAYGATWQYATCGMRVLVFEFAAYGPTDGQLFVLVRVESRQRVHATLYDPAVP
eukprot:2320652-Rhodomonas_salina.1